MKEQIKKILDSEPIKFFPTLRDAQKAQSEKNDRLADQIATLCEAECQKRIDTMFNPDYLDFKKGVEAGRSLAKAGCQARVEKLIEDMEQYKTLDVIIISPEAWQAIKEEYNV